MTLIEFLFEAFDLMYLSDLQYAELERRIIGRILPYLDEKHFSINEWNKAIAYLYGAPLSFSTVAEAQAFARRNPLEQNTRRKPDINQPFMNGGIQ